jgi:hypothetical protein
VTWLLIGSIVFALAAAVLWFLSAVVKTPDSYSVHVVRPRSGLDQPLGGDPIGGAYIGQAYSNDFVSLANALRRQSKLSAWAAVCAGVSAAPQALLLYFQQWP